MKQIIFCKHEVPSENAIIVFLKIILLGHILSIIKINLLFIYQTNTIYHNIL
jgi:hypothetical protein